MLTPVAPETPSDLVRANRVCAAFEAAWRDGPRPRVEDYCRGPDGGQDLTLAAELIDLDAHFRRAAGEKPTPDDYLARFPGLGRAAVTALVTGTAVEDRTLTPGRGLGRFTLISRVGAGACGSVWRAYDTALGRVVALKIPHPAAVATPDALERFRREARVAARLRHPGIVTVHEVAESDGFPVLVEEFVAGESLREHLARQRLIPREAASVAADLAEALDYAHRHGAVHRDVKPGNVVLPSAPGPPILVDFGLAADGPESDLTADGQLIGTPAYMAPEQARGDARAADARTDVYALGVVLYEMLTGRPPFHGTRAMLLRQVLEDEPRPPRRLDERMPRDLETVCLKAMAKEPVRRYPTAAEFAADLRRFLAGEAVKARPVGPVVRTLRWARRKPTAAALLTVSTAAACVILCGAVWYSALLAAANGKLSAAVVRETEAADAARRQADTILAQAEAGRRAQFALTLAQIPALWQRDPVRVGDILNDRVVCPPDLQDFTWRYFGRLCRLGQGNLSTGGGPTNALALSPDGNRLVTGSADGSVRVWDWRDRRAVATVKDYKGGVSAVCVSPDGRWFASGGPDGRIVVRDLSDGSLVAEFVGHTGKVSALGWPTPGPRVVSAGADATVRVWDVRKRVPAARWDSPVGAVKAMNASAGRAAIAGARSPGVSVLDLDSGTVIASWPETAGAVTSLAYSPDGRFLAQGCQDRTTLIRQSSSGKVAARLGGHLLEAAAVAFSPDGQYLAVGSRDGHLRVVAVATGEPRTNILKNPIRCLAYGPGECLAAGSDTDDQVVLWRLPPPPRPIRVQKTGLSALAESRGRVATGTLDGGVWVWEPDGGSTLVIPPGRNGVIRALTWSPDGKTLVIGAENTPEFWVWDGSDPAAAVRGHNKAVVGAAFDPTGTYLATASRDATVRIWDARLLTPVASLTGHTKDAKAVCFSPDGALLASAGEECEVRLWDARRWTPLGVLGRHDGWALCAAFDPSGRRLATGGKDRLLRVWDVAGRRQQFCIPGFTNWVYSVGYTPDGRTLLAATGVPWIGADAGEVQFIDPEAGYVRAVLDKVASPMVLDSAGRSVLASTPLGVAELRAADEMP